MAKKQEKELSLESVLWNCRVALRGVGSTEKNRDAVISLVFVKFAYDKFIVRRDALIQKFGDNPVFIEEPAFYNEENVFFLPENSRWDYLVKEASANDIAKKIDDAMQSIEEKNESLNGTLPKGLFVSLGAEKKDIKSLIDEVNKINSINFHEEDLIGRVYEYFLRAYAASGTKEDGEFYTPASVVRLIAELLEPYNGTVYDPCCGSGGMFVQSMKFIDSHHGSRNNVSIIGQEKIPETWRLCKMNLAVRGISYNLGKTFASTFTDDQHKDKDRKINFIMANPPFNLKGWRAEDELTHDKRFSGYEVMPPVANANYAWILHMLSKLDPSNGVAGFLLANGALNADGDEYKIRKQIIKNDKIEAIIVLPRDMFYTTDISVTLWILNMNKKGGLFNGRNLRNRENEILFMDLRTWDDNIDEIALEKGKKKKTAFNDEQITRIKNIYESWRSADSSGYKDIPELCRSVKFPEIEANDFSLAPSRYIEFIDHDLEIDYEKEMKRIQQEIKDVLKEEKESQKLLEEAFKGIGYGIC